MTKPTSAAALIREILGSLFADQGSGRVEIVDVDLEGLIGAIVLSGAAGGLSLELTPAVRAIFDGLLARARIDESDGPEQVSAKLDAYYTAHPVRGDLLHVVTRLMRELTLEAPSEGSKRALAAVGTTESVTPLINRGARPAGSVPGGPMARFLIAKREENKQDAQRRAR